MKILIFLSLFITISSCGLNSGPSVLVFKDNTENKVVIDPIKNEDAAFINIQKVLFEQSCNNCHNPKKPKRLDLTNKENLIKEYDDILYRMTDAFDTGADYMPPKGDAVSKQVIEAFKAWKKSEDMK